MDIARIRKKLKNPGAAGGQPEGGPTSKPEDKSAEPENRHPEPAHGRTDDAEPEAGQTGKGKEVTKTGKESGSTSTHAIKKEKTKPTDNKSDSGSGQAEETIEILTFRLAKEEFAFRISQLKEILRYQRITAVPKVPDYVIGITSLRGKIIPVIDLRLKLSLSDQHMDHRNAGKILIVDGPRGPIGASVDKVIGVVRIAKSEILPPPSHLSESEVKFIEGIAMVDKRFISIINMEETVPLDLR